MDLFAATEAREARDRAIALHEKTDAGKEWLRRAKLHAEAIAIKQGKVTIDDVRASIGAPPKECDPRINGAVFKGRKWRKVGQVQSTRKECHARPIAVYELRGS